MAKRVAGHREVAITAALLLAACGEGAVSAARQEIIGGTPDERQTFPEVCTFVGELFPGGPTASGCTATLISPTALVTAAHCSQVFTSSPGVSCAPEVHLDSPRLPGHFVVHPGYAGDLSTIGQDPHDVAVFVLDEAITGVKPLRLSRAPAAAVARADAPEVPVTIVGYGIDREFDPALLFEYLLLDPKVRRVGASRLSGVTPEYLRLDPAPAIGCFLDSGSPAFLGRSTVLLGTLQATDCAAFVQYVRVGTDANWEFLQAFLP